NQLLKVGITGRALTEVLARYGCQLVANDPGQYKALGKLLGSMGRTDPNEIAPLYFRQLMAALKKCATRSTHTNVLQHLCGYLTQTITSEDKQEIQQVIAQYPQGIVPLIVPLTLLTPHCRHHPDPYVALQSDMQPPPATTSLRHAIRLMDDTATPLAPRFL
ncbi:DUF1722 domain-containing protein, partial [Pseudomonas syringae]